MPPEDRFVCPLRRRAAAGARCPTAGWADTLQAEFLAACLRIDTEGEELGEAGDDRPGSPTARGRAHLRAR